MIYNLKSKIQTQAQFFFSSFSLIFYWIWKLLKSADISRDHHIILTFSMSALYPDIVIAWFLLKRNISPTLLELGKIKTTQMTENVNRYNIPHYLRVCASLKRNPKRSQKEPKCRVFLFFSFDWIKWIETLVGLVIMTV